MYLSPSSLLSLGALLIASTSALKCSPSSISKPDVLGATILDLQANEAHNYTTVSIGPGSNNGGKYTISFCNVTVTHTHAGWNDTIATQIWLPLHDDWNGRFQGLGGGGYSTGFGPIYLAYAVAQGFASASTDGGVPGDPGAVTTIATDLSWALSSKDNVNWFLLQDYATKATNDMAEIGKQVTESYYNRAPEYSYFSGCSGGGRQGFAMAQQFPDAFDGVLAVAPAINLETFIPAGYWPTQVMNDNQIYPSPCEIDAFVSAAVEACDGLDGVQDGMISLPHLCNVTAFDLVGKHYTCNGTQHSLSPSAAKVVQAAWSGSLSRNPEEAGGYYGINKDAPLSSYYIPTECPARNNSTSTCHTSNGASLFGNWISYLVAKDPSFSLSQISEAEFFSFLTASKTEYASLLAANNPDMSAFKARGGKMITWQGLADEVIPPGGLVEYHKRVLELDSNAGDFFRVFEAPGVNHCFGGPGPVPNDALEQLMEWVEMGVKPDTLRATRGSGGAARDLCPFPMRQRYIGGDPADAMSFECVEV
ncbi:Tannase/feruloyl esterase [Aspergillus stella-maris]|uniref:Tannase/feruloyl esterase n=1 Tax=Aspergillus stella-maris TaxID=1810926 RepID=UPI003CCD7C37